MSSFLEKLKSGGGSTVNNFSPPDVCGVVVRRIEKLYANQPVEELGMALTDDAEVTHVQPNSLAHAANIAPGYIVMDVNGEFVEDARQFVALAARSLNLTLRMQSSSAISELIARILQAEESDLQDEVSSQIDFQELLRTTPRYSFLSNEHPLFRRYINRLQSRRDATALIRQRMQEAEDKQRRDILRNIAREREAAEQEAAKAAALAAEQQHEGDVRAKSPDRGGCMEDTHENVALVQQAQDGLFMRIIDDQSAFHEGSDVHAANAPTPYDENTRCTAHIGRDSPLSSSASSSSSMSSSDSDTDESSSSEDSLADTTATTLLQRNGVAETENHAQESSVSQSQLASELLALIGAPTDVCLPEPRAATSRVVYTKLPTEVYTTATGEEVVLTLKKRAGPLPSAPVGRPPKINHEAQAMMDRQGATSGTEACVKDRVRDASDRCTHVAAVAKAPLRMSPVRCANTGDGTMSRRHAERGSRKRDRREKDVDPGCDGRRSHRVTSSSLRHSSHRHRHSRDRSHRSRHDHGSRPRHSDSREGHRRRHKDQQSQKHASSSHRRRDRSSSLTRRKARHRSRR